MKNFDRSKIKKKIQIKYSLAKKIIILIGIIALLLICFLFNITNNNILLENKNIKEDYVKYGKLSLIDVADIYKNKIYEFVSNSEIYYFFEINQNNEISSVYIPKSQTKIIYEENQFPKIEVFKQEKTNYIYDNLLKKYSSDENYQYYYEIFINSDTIIENIGEIDLKNNNNTGTFIWYTFPMPIRMF